MKTFVLVTLLSVFLIPVLSVAQTAQSDSAGIVKSLQTDSAAVFHFHANVEKSLNPDFEKGRPDFFRTSQLDIIYTNFFSVLADSAGVKLFPIEKLMALKGRPKSEYPQYSFKNAKKRGEAAFYIKAEIMFFDAGAGNSTKTSSKLSLGKLSGKKTAQQQLLRMVSVVEVYDATGMKIKEVESSIISETPVTLSSLDGLDFQALGKLAFGKKKEEPKPESDPFVDLIKAGAAQVASSLK